jgi:hypothetical protein
VNDAPEWQVEHFAAPANNALPRPAAVASKLPAGGAGLARLCWYSRSAGSFGATRSSPCAFTSIPRRGSLKAPWPAICVTATYRFQ